MVPTVEAVLSARDRVVALGHRAVGLRMWPDTKAGFEQILGGRIDFQRFGGMAFVQDVRVPPGQFAVVTDAERIAVFGPKEEGSG